MPVTQIPYPILSQFGCAVTKTTGMPPQPLDATPEQKAQVGEEDKTPKQLPKGVVLGPDGKPYVWMFMYTRKMLTGIADVGHAHPCPRGSPWQSRVQRTLPR